MIMSTSLLQSPSLPLYQHISHSPELLTSSLTQLSSLLTELSPFLYSPQNASNSVLLQEIGPLANMTEAIKSPAVTPVLHKLVAVNAFIQLFVNLSRSCQAGYNVSHFTWSTRCMYRWVSRHLWNGLIFSLQTESRLLCVNHWASPIGKTVLNQLSDLYRALVWEGFILLAVAAGKDSSSADSNNGDASKEPSGAPPSPQAMELEGGVPVVPGSEVPIVVVDMPEEVGGVTATDPAASAHEQQESPGSEDVVASKPCLPVVPPDQVSQHPSILVESLKQLTPLLTITSRVGRSLAELMSLLVRLSTSPLHRVHRRGMGHPLIMHSYQEPAKEAIGVCMQVSNLLVDSLKWEVPMPEACSSAMQSPIRDWLFAG